ncbi:MAG: MGH1-like glycoside hydrolase domain-containing protein [Planctomycetota bacterium]
MIGFEHAAFSRALPIAPHGPSDPWPGERRGPLYWVARVSFDLDEAPAEALWTVAADRHYLLYVNGMRVARQCNFFSGDLNLVAQQLDARATRALRSGANTITAVVRSDPWKNKNYRPFRPMLMLEATCIDGTPLLKTDASWQSAVAENWHDFLWLSTTRAYEKIHLTASDRSWEFGLPMGLNFRPAHLLDKATLPPIQLWTDRPKQTVVRTPLETTAGRCVTPSTALHFDLASCFEDTSTQATLRCTFHAEAPGRLRLATTAIRRHTIELNGHTIGGCDRDPAYDSYNLKHLDAPAPRRTAGHFPYLRQTACGTVNPGVNQLTITAHRSRGWNELHLAAAGAASQAVMDASCWQVNGSAPSLQTMDLPEDLGMNALMRLDDQCVHVEHSPFRAVVEPDATRPRMLLVDFGKLANSVVSFTLRAAGPGTVKLAYGGLRQGDAVDCARMNRRCMDIFDVPRGRSRHEGMMWRHFRYLLFVFEGFDAEVELSELKAEEDLYLPDGDIHWQSDDSNLDGILRAGLRTAQLCCGELYMDNPDREQAQWMDNSTPNAAAGYYWFGESRKAAQYLNTAIRHQQADGQIQGYSPGRWHRHVKPYQCHLGIFAQALSNHYLHTGDRQWGLDALESLGAILDHWQRHIGPSGLVENLHTVFIDWGSHFYSYARAFQKQALPKHTVLTGMNAYVLGALRAASTMARHLDHNRQAEAFDQTAQELAEAMVDRLYDKQLGLFRDGAFPEEALEHVSQPANALAVWFGAVDRQTGHDILTRAFGANAPQDIIPSSAHFAFQTGSALFEAGCDRLALEWIHRGFGPMIEAGSQTLWETFEDAVSLCQGTGAAIPYLLARYVTGLYPAAPGWAEIGVAPQCGHLRKATARMQTVDGALQIGWSRDDSDRLEVRLAIPPHWQDRPIRCASGVSLKVDTTS